MEALKRDPMSVDLSSRLRALRDFAIELTGSPQTMKRQGIDRLRDEGMEDPEILHAAEIVAYFNYINRVADALGIDPETDSASHHDRLT